MCSSIERDCDVTGFWWDFEGENKIIIETDNDAFKILASFSYDNINGGEPASPVAQQLGIKRVGQAENAIKTAENIISELKKGQLTLLECEKKYGTKTIFIF